MRSIFATLALPLSVLAVACGGSQGAGDPVTVEEEVVDAAAVDSGDSTKSDEQAPTSQVEDNGGGSSPAVGPVSRDRTGPTVTAAGAPGH
jgi:hypothetical protein